MMGRGSHGASVRRDSGALTVNKIGVWLFILRIYAIFVVFIKWRFHSLFFRGIFKLFRGGILVLGDILLI
jgi:hypothetical protein